MGGNWHGLNEKKKTIHATRLCVDVRGGGSSKGYSGVLSSTGRGPRKGEIIPPKLNRNLSRLALGRIESRGGGFGSGTHRNFGHGNPLRQRGTSSIGGRGQSNRVHFHKEDVFSKGKDRSQI